MKYSMFVLLLLSLLCLCCSENTANQKTANMYPSATFDNTRWTLIKLKGLDSLPDLQKDVFIQFNASDSSFKGHAGCNNMMGKYSLDGNNLSIGPTAMTRMMCAPENMNVENGLSTAINQADSYVINEDHLELKKGNELLAEFQAFDLK